MSRTAVTPEPNADFDPKATDEWLDGLAGRGGASAAAQEAAALRDSLKPSDAELAATKVPAWVDIVAAADRPLVATPAPMSDRSANESHWKRFALGGMAVAVLAVGVGLWVLPPQKGGGDGGMRGTPSAGGPVWKTENPTTAARELAARLEGVGARVNLTLMNDGARLDVECGSAGAQRLNQELATIEVAVDSNCHLSLQISSSSSKPVRP